MKPRMMSKPAMDHLFDHILGGHETSFEGIKNLEAQGLVSPAEVTELLKKNEQRLIDRIKEFKAIHRLVCIFFACLFGYMQATGEDLEMRRSRPGVRIRSSSSRRSSRRNENENIMTL